MMLIKQFKSLDKKIRRDSSTRPLEKAWSAIKESFFCDFEVKGNNDVEKVSSLTDEQIKELLNKGRILLRPKITQPSWKDVLAKWEEHKNSTGETDIIAWLMNRYNPPAQKKAGGMRLDFSTEMGIDKLVDYKNHKRLKVFFNKGVKCVCCPRVGTRLIYGYDGGGGKHLDLYTDDLVMMTVHR